MRTLVSALLIAAVAACGGSTDTAATRYNFAVIDGRNQLSTAGAPTLARPITSQLTRDPQGRFATRVFDLLAPAKAYAQGLTLAGTPIANQIVCGREAAPGEPQVVPLCVFTLADGTAPSTIQGGTKAGTYNVVFTAQVPSQEPVKDSTTVTVAAGPVYSSDFDRGVTYQSGWPAPFTLPEGALQDRYKNPVPYRFVSSAYVHAAGDTLGTAAARTLVADSAGSGDLMVQTPAGPFVKGHVVVEIAFHTDGTLAYKNITLTFPGVAPFVP